MKKIWWGWAALVIGITCGALYAFNPFKKESWEKLGKDIKGVAEDVGGKVSGAAEDVVDRIKACALMEKLGIEWAAKKVAYKTAQKGVAVAKGVVKGSLDIGKGGAELTGAILQLGSDAISKGIHIKRVYLSGKIADFEEGEFPEFQVEGTAFGQDFDTKLQIDVSEPADMVKKLIEKIF